jgi:hypothetical protein
MARKMPRRTKVNNSTVWLIFANKLSPDSKMAQKFMEVFRKMKARRRLQQMTDAKRQSFETQRFIRNRAAQIQRRAKIEASAPQSSLASSPQ